MELHAITEQSSRLGMMIFALGHKKPIVAITGRDLPGMSLILVQLTNRSPSEGQYIQVPPHQKLMKSLERARDRFNSCLFSHAVILSFGTDRHRLHDSEWSVERTRNISIAATQRWISMGRTFHRIQSVHREIQVLRLPGPRSLTASGSFGQLRGLGQSLSLQLTHRSGSISKYFSSS
jgi:hypothetical protein